MRKTFLLKALPAGLALVLGGAALAQSGGSGSVQTPAPVPGTTGAPGNTGQGAASLQSLDANGDGQLSSSEASGNADLAGQFTTLDRNRDGRLDSSEFSRFEMTGTGGTTGSGSGTGGTLGGGSGSNTSGTTGGGGTGNTGGTSGTGGNSGNTGTSGGTNQGGTQDRSGSGDRNRTR